jgi:cytochrome b subunit of formate dehydrogenase
VLSFVEITTVVSLLIAYLFNPKQERYDYVVKITSWSFTILGVTLLVTGIFMICTLKANFPVYYQEFKCILWAAAIGMAIPMFFRGVID